MVIRMQHRISTLEIDFVTGVLKEMRDGATTRECGAELEEALELLNGIRSLEVSGGTEYKGRENPFLRSVG